MNDMNDIIWQGKLLLDSEFEDGSVVRVRVVPLGDDDLNVQVDWAGKWIHPDNIAGIPVSERIRLVEAALTMAVLATRNAAKTSKALGIPCSKATAEVTEAILCYAVENGLDAAATPHEDGEPCLWFSFEG